MVRPKFWATYRRATSLECSPPFSSLVWTTSYSSRRVQLLSFNACKTHCHRERSGGTDCAKQEKQKGGMWPPLPHKYMIQHVPYVYITLQSIAVTNLFQLPAFFCSTKIDQSTANPTSFFRFAKIEKTIFSILTPSTSKAVKIYTPSNGISFEILFFFVSLFLDWLEHVVFCPLGEPSDSKDCCDFRTIWDETIWMNTSWVSQHPASKFGGRLAWSQKNHPAHQPASSKPQRPTSLYLPRFLRRNLRTAFVVCFFQLFCLCDSTWTTFWTDLFSFGLQVFRTDWGRGWKWSVLF